MPVLAPVLRTVSATLDRRPAAAQLQLGEPQARVGEPEAERVRRRLGLRVVPAVADEHALLVVDRSPTPGYFSGSPAVGRSASRRGNVAGRRPPGSTSPKSTRAIAGPPSWPGYQASSSAGDLVAPRRQHRAAGLEHDDRVRLRAPRPRRSAPSWSPWTGGHSSVRQRAVGALGLVVGGERRSRRRRPWRSGRRARRRRCRRRR